MKGRGRIPELEGQGGTEVGFEAGADSGDGLGGA